MPHPDQGRKSNTRTDSVAADPAIAGEKTLEKTGFDLDGHRTYTPMAAETFKKDVKRVETGPQVFKRIAWVPMEPRKLLVFNGNCIISMR